MTNWRKRKVKGREEVVRTHLLLRSSAMSDDYEDRARKYRRDADEDVSNDRSDGEERSRKG